MPNDIEQEIVRDILGGTAPTQALLLPALLEIQRRVGHVPT